MKNSPCVLSTNGFAENYCKRHSQYHTGRNLALALGTDEESQKARDRWDKQPVIKIEPPPKPIRQPLSLVKLCQHNTGVNGTAKAGCTTCTTYGCNVHGTVRLKDCVYCEDYQEKPAPKAGSSWQAIRFDHTNLHPEIPGVRFNPSIIESNDGYLFAFRNGWRGSRIYVCRLTKDFVPIPGEWAKLALPTSGVIGHEDCRLFRLNGKLHVMYVAYTGRRTHVKFSRINEEKLTVEDSFFPQLTGRASWEKNWMPFDYQGIAHFIYSINPHQILRVEGNKAEWSYKTDFTGKWSGGYMRGGAAPVRVGDEMFHFFHGAYNIAGRRRYCTGVYTFNPEPPFNILRYTPEPIDAADLDRKHDNYCDVLFVGGAMLGGDKWITANGIHDRWSEIRFYDRQTIDEQLVICPTV